MGNKRVVSAFYLFTSSFELCNPRMVWFGRDFKTHPVPTPWVKIPLLSVQVKLLPPHSGGFWNKISVSTQNFALIKEICLKFHLHWDPYFCAYIENFQLNALGIPCPWNRRSAICLVDLFITCFIIVFIICFCIYHLPYVFHMHFDFLWSFRVPLLLLHLPWKFGDECFSLNEES